ncbi:MAG: hypothetical protein U0794_21815 [Isosphaeraceae bacterium]
MNYEPSELIHRYLDGLLDPTEEATLNDWIKADPLHAREFAALTRLHNSLRDVMPATPSELPSEPARPRRSEQRRVRRRRLAYAIGMFALVSSSLALWSFFPTQLNASTELDRIIAQAEISNDRSYRIQNLDARPETTDDQKPPIDGATLDVRPPNQYVLTRRYPDGRVFVTGSDGERSWAVPPAGPVHVSDDPMRFRGPVPGHQHGIPFTNLRSDLVQLRDAYDLSVLPTRPDGLRGLRAVKKSAGYRGPRRVDLWYDARSGIIQEMNFGGMPQARGGPDSVAVRLQSQAALAPDHFGHEAHHASDRPVSHEE